MKNISVFKDCYGCGVCATACPKKIIEIRLNKDGFYTPYIAEQNKCIECNICIDVCALYNEKPIFSQGRQMYSAYSKSGHIRHICSSGGVSFEIGKYLIGKGYKVCGVTYNADTQRAEHLMCSSIEDLKKTIGSKYIPSFTHSGFTKINKKDKFLITGTPCQIDSLRRYIRKYNIEEHFILLDFFCHGVPSMNIWHKYNRYITNVYNIQSPTFTWRDKRNGWHNSYTTTINTLEDDICIPQEISDNFYRLFFGHFCLNKVCYDNCIYKLTASSADIRIGDMWGTKYQNNQEGISAIITYTDKGDEIIKNIQSINLSQESAIDILAGQMARPPRRPFGYKLVMWLLKSSIGIRPVTYIARLTEFIDRKLKITRKK